MLNLIYWLPQRHRSPVQYSLERIHLFNLRIHEYVRILHSLSLLLIQPLPNILKRVRHLLLDRVRLVYNLPFSCLQPLLNHVQIIYLWTYVDNQVFQFVCYNWVRLFNGLDVVALVVSVDHAFWADGLAETLEAEVVDLLVWVRLAVLTLKSHGVLCKVVWLVDGSLVGFHYRFNRGGFKSWAFS